MQRVPSPRSRKAKCQHYEMKESLKIGGSRGIRSLTRTVGTDSSSGCNSHMQRFVGTERERDNLSRARSFESAQDADHDVQRVGRPAGVARHTIGLVKGPPGPRPHAITRSTNFTEERESSLGLSRAGKGSHHIQLTRIVMDYRRSIWKNLPGKHEGTLRRHKTQTPPRQGVRDSRQFRGGGVLSRR